MSKNTIKPDINTAESGFMTKENELRDKQLNRTQLNMKVISKHTAMGVVSQSMRASREFNNENSKIVGNFTQGNLVKNKNLLFAKQVNEGTGKLPPSPSGDSVQMSFKSHDQVLKNRFQLQNQAAQEAIQEPRNIISK